MNITTVKQGVSGDAYGVVQFWLLKSMFCFAKFEYISLITTAKHEEKYYPQYGKDI